MDWYCSVDSSSPRTCGSPATISLVLASNICVPPSRFGFLICPLKSASYMRNCSVPTMGESRYAITILSAEHASILQYCVNSLIYSEAAPVLYDCNIINIHYSYDSLWPIQSRNLFRTEDDVSTVTVGARTGRLWTCRPERLMNYPLARPATHRLVKIHPHRLRRMSQIEITIKTAGVYCGATLCEDGPEQRLRILSLLMSLICVPGSNQTFRRTLTLIHEPHHIKPPPSPRSKEMRELFDYMNQKRVLLQCLSRIRMVQAIIIFNDINQSHPNTGNCHPSKAVETTSTRLRHAPSHYFLTPLYDENWMRELEEKTARKIVGRLTEIAD